MTYGDWLGHVLNTILPKWITDSVIGQITSRIASLLVWRRPDSYFDSELSYMLGQISSLGFFNGGSRLTLVGHSHGTIYANILYRRITTSIIPAYRLEPQQIGLMSVAAFTPRIEGGGLYVTNRNDNPVNSGRAVYSDVLAGTVTIPHTEPAAYVWRGHNLINKYLADPNSKLAIVGNMKGVMDRLASAAPTPGYTPPPSWSTTEFSTVTYHPCPACPAYWWVNGVQTLFTGPFIWWYVPGGSLNNAARLGAPQDARDQARVNAQACYDKTITALLPLKQAGNPSWPFIPGCWPNTSGPYGAWWVYSGEGPPAFRSVWDSSRSQATATGGATCQRT